MCLSKQTREAILKRLEDIGLSQADLARMMDLDPQYVNAILRGRKNISMKRADEIVSLIGGRIRVTIEPEN